MAFGKDKTTTTDDCDDDNGTPTTTTTTKRCTGTLTGEIVLECECCDGGDNCGPWCYQFVEFPCSTTRSEARAALEQTLLQNPKWQFQQLIDFNHDGWLAVFMYCCEDDPDPQTAP